VYRRAKPVRPSASFKVRPSCSKYDTHARPSYSKKLTSMLFLQILGRASKMTNRMVSVCTVLCISVHCIDIQSISVLSLFCRQYKVNCCTNLRAIGKLQVAVDTCKRVLSTINVAQCSIDSLHDGIDFNSTLSRWALLNYLAIMTTVVCNWLCIPVSDMLNVQCWALFWIP